jgi:uncharacterized membrane protein YcaP (DUF421 family)
MFNVILKAVIIYGFVMMTMRLMGKRQVGQLQPFDLVISIIIAEIAATPMANAGIPITYSLAPIITLLFLHSMIAFVMVKSEKARAFFCGKPTMLINRGMIDKKSMTELDYNLNDLLEQLRLKDVVNTNDVQYAILETNGGLSVVLKPEKSALTPSDMSQTPDNKGFYYAIILDGKINKKNMQSAALSPYQIYDAVSRLGFGEIKAVFFATVNEAGEFFGQSMDGKQNSVNVKDSGQDG